MKTAPSKLTKHKSNHLFEVVDESGLGAVPLLEDHAGQQGGDVSGVQAGQHVVEDQLRGEQLVGTDLARHPPLQLHRAVLVQVVQPLENL